MFKTLTMISNFIKKVNDVNFPMINSHKNGHGIFKNLKLEEFVINEE